MHQRHTSTLKYDPEDVTLIDNALAAPSYALAFQPALEAQFRADGRAGRLRYQRRVGYITFALLLLSLPTTAELVPDVFHLALALAAPAMFCGSLMLAMLQARNPNWLTDLAAMMFILPGLAVEITLFATSHAPDRVAFIDSLPLYTIGANVCFQQRFPWAAAGSACALCIILTGIGFSSNWAAAEHAEAGTAISAVLLSLMITHRLEWQNRRAWLFRARDALSNARLLALAERDGLTGLANRRAVDDWLEHAWAACVAGNTPLSVIMIDVDWFKLYNDHYGHPAGDACLRAVGAAIAGQVRRQGDLAGRYGGEEFILILPGADPDTSNAIAQRVCETIQELEVPHVAGPSSAFVTASLGVATTIPAAGGSVGTLLTAADAALYEAKRTGRARVACAEMAG